MGGGVGNIPTTYIQITVAGSKKICLEIGRQLLEKRFVYFLILPKDSNPQFACSSMLAVLSRKGVKNFVRERTRKPNTGGNNVFLNGKI